ncbi:MAG TPA: ABC transporter ATP-binding protein [Pirellulales bacterium]|nr:ABC transporter ATP-binding protein [Pirellulales bacterium]
MSNLETASRPTTARDSTELLIDVSGLRKQFKQGKEVLRGVNLEVPRGTVLGLLGKNGAGKTTLIKCLLGLLKPTDGSATLLGENAWDLSAQAKERLGYVPQVVTLYTWMKVKHLMAYTAAFYRNWNAELGAELVQRWEIPLDDFFGMLSVGQQQRLAIVLSLAYEPELLILDEPAASLDPMARREFLSEVLNIADQLNRTVVFSTHITSDLERVADTVAILKEGKIAYHGELGELKDSIKRLHFSAAAPLPSSFVVPGALSTRIDGHHAMVATRDLSPELISALCHQWKADVQIEDLSLEEIFLEMHQP